MRKINYNQGINRIIDANINRAKEGLRVCEEIVRFILKRHNLTTAFKKIRHSLVNMVKDLVNPSDLIKGRQSQRDIGRKIYINELKRLDYKDIFFANIQRVKESVRVLEEFSKLKNIDLAKKFKKTRYHLYELEKKVSRKLLPLRHHR